MLTIENVNENDVLSITASGKLTEQDYKQALPKLETLLKNHDTVRFFIKLEDCSGVEMKALWEDLKFDVKHQEQFGKTAVVGETESEKWMTDITDVFSRAKMKFYSPEQSDEAWTWVNN